MGRIVRFVKTAFFILSAGVAVFMFSAFSHSPLVVESFKDLAIKLGLEAEKYIPEQLKADIRAQIEDLRGGSREKDKSNRFSKVVLPATVMQVPSQLSIQKGSTGEGMTSSDIPSQDEAPSIATGITTFQGRDWVFIEGKYFLYNPENVYTVNGVRTFFKPNIHKPIQQAELDLRMKSPKIVQAVAQHGLQALAVQPTGNSALDTAKTVLRGYSPSGMMELKKNLQLIQEGMKQRNEALKSLQQENM